MNKLEKRMVDVLKDLKENHQVVGVKAEFEAEGTRLEEALRLKEIVTKAGLELTIKIGGCEAIKDMYDARAIGVSQIVAPMIESPYALKKYLSAVKLAFPQEERETVSFLINIETIDGYRRFSDMLSIPELGQLKGIVFGRVDMTGSLGMSREEVNSPEMLKIAERLFMQAKEKSLECVIGGGVSKELLAFIGQLPPGFVDRYETRKVIFQCPEVPDENAEKGILKAVGFELMWLKNKRDFYGIIYEEDRLRIELLQSRYDKLIKEAGGQVE